MNTRWNIQIIRYFLDDPIANICRPHLHHDYSAKQTIKQKAARMCKCVVVCMMNMFVPIQRSENVQYRRCNTCQYFYASHSMHVCVCVCGSVLVESKRSTEWVDNRIILPFKVIKWVEGSQYLPNHCSSLYLAKSIINPEMSARSKTTHHQSIKIDVLSTKFDTRYEMLQDISLITFNNLIMLSTILLSNIERHFYFTFCVVLVGGRCFCVRCHSFRWHLSPQNTYSDDMHCVIDDKLLPFASYIRHQYRHRCRCHCHCSHSINLFLCIDRNRYTAHYFAGFNFLRLFDRIIFFFVKIYFASYNHPCLFFSSWYQPYLLCSFSCHLSLLFVCVICWCLFPSD